MKRLLLLSLVTAAVAAVPLMAQEETAEPVAVAIFPFKNLHNAVEHEDLAWSYADSLQNWLMTQEPAGTRYTIISMDEIRDQMLATNVDVKSPSYETDVWKVARALGAKLLIWGTYFVKYDKSNIEVKVFDVKLVMDDPDNKATGIRVPYAQSLQTVPEVGMSIINGLR